MEFLTSSFIPKPNIFPSNLSPPPSLTSFTNKTRFKSRKTHLKSSSNSPFPPIISRFGGPTKRRNSLRKKLIDINKKSKVSQNNSKFNDPVHNFVDNDAYDASLDGKILNLEQKGNNFGGSPLYDRLESWVELYKKDIEFWGIGSNPIFTIVQDFDGNVEKVLVDEDEILRRGGVEPLSFRDNSELEVFDEVNSKISHARLLAREIESGKKDVISKKSSVANFVVSGESGTGNGGWIGRIRSVSVSRNVVRNVSWVGIGVVCGFVAIWVAKRVFDIGGKGTELTGFEKELLRRKIKARMEKEKLETGTVDVVGGGSELVSVITERPQVDKEGVLDSIRKAKGLSNDLSVVHVGSDREAGSLEMDFKIKEIQMMARRARESEKEVSEDEGSELDGETSSKPVEEKDKSVEVVDSITRGEMTHDLKTGESDEMGVVNGIAETEISDDREQARSDSKIGSEEVPEGIKNVEHNAFSGKVADDDKSQIPDVIHSHSKFNSSDSTERILSSDVSSSQLNSTKNKSRRRMPKIICSVQEAREYLSHKHDQMPGVGRDVGYGGTGELHSVRLGEDIKVAESYVDKILDPNPAANVDDHYVVKENESCRTVPNGLNNETQLKGEIDSSGDTKHNLEETRKTNHCNSSGISESISGPDVCDGSLVVNEYVESEKCFDIVGNLHEMPKPNDLSDISDLVPGRHASHDIANSGGAPGPIAKSDLHSANLEEKADLWNETVLHEVNGHEEISEPANSSETSAPLTAGDELDSPGLEKNGFVPIERTDDQDSSKNSFKSEPLTAETSQDFQNSGGNRGDKLFADKENWLEKNFHEVEPVVNKISSGFRDSYMAARERVKQEAGDGLGFIDLGSVMNDSELEWMQNNELRDIVFKVRDNELAGQDPFHAMSLEEKTVFLQGLESKVEKENKKLSVLHEWLHSNIENLDYGADGISIYDPPEKIIPKWKGPPIDTLPEFLSNIRKQQQEASSLQNVNESLQNVNESPQPDETKTFQEGFVKKLRPKETNTKFSRTVIEASDGSIRPGKKSGKEYWEHTKKWSRGFLDVYNAETDPEVKSVMKDIGKDLDRWITEEEIKKAADLMDRIPQRGKDIIQKKVSKLRRQVEQFGPQAVVSKYSEYADDKEEDYLWWLDLPHVLCIEMYINEGEDMNVGFYTLEMAQDLEIEPKPQHLVAFQDPGDCKHFCYIMQAHLDMLGKGKAFVVPQPPKDVFRQAKANGFGVTVIRKGELQLNVDLKLEEVEEHISEVGTKMYHDKIMKERSVDINALMKGVFGFGKKPIQRKRKKRARKRHSKP